MGAVRAPHDFSFAELKELPRVESMMLLECAGNGRRRMAPLPAGVPWDFGAVGTAVFEGVPLESILQHVGVASHAVEVLFRGADSGDVGNGWVVHFERSMPIAAALVGDVLLADTMNGEPLTREHGYPVRIVVPRWYAVASVKWLTEIIVLDHPFHGHFQTEKYRFINDPAVENGSAVRVVRVRSIFTSPADGSTVIPGPVTISGLAWSGAAPVTSVEISTDGGAAWSAAQLEPAVGHGPARWSFAWHAAPGSHHLFCRATDAEGNSQPVSAVHNDLGYGNNVVHAIRISVEP